MMNIKKYGRRFFSATVQEKRGILTFDKLKQKGFPDFYGRLNAIKVIPDYFIKNYEKGIVIDSSAFHSDIEGVVIDKSKCNKNLLLKPDVSNIREMAWMKGKSYLVMGDVHTPNDGKLYQFSPKNILIQKVEEMKQAGYIVNGASELEYFLYNKKYSENKEKGLTKLKEMGSHCEDYLIQQGDKLDHIYEKFRTKLKESGVIVETTKGEASIGQHEINVAHSDAIGMSDIVLVLKSCLKNVAEQNNATITFMSKPSRDRFGSSSHLHISLHAMDGKNLFPGSDYKINDNLSCSNDMLYFLGGLMKYSLDTFLFFAPTINSYKRYKNFSWAPSNLDSWSVDNRTSPFRICGSGKSLRIEYRIPGGDINQYLAYSGLIAAGLEGLKNKITPPAISEGNAYSKGNSKRPPVDLIQALSIFEKSEFIENAFGKDVHQHLIKFYKNEIDTYERVVTKWEYSRYLDLI